MIGVRDAKARFSQLVHDAERGREWIITDRGNPVAKIGPITQIAVPLEERLRRLEESGMLEPAHVTSPLPPPLPIEAGLARRLLDSDRGR